MALLGSSFPVELKSRKLKVGSIVYTYCPFTKPPKNKYHLICCCEPLLVMLINSNVVDFIRCKQELNACQVELKKEDHPFLEWDSFVNYIDAHETYDISFFKNELENNFLAFYKGDISHNCARDVIYAANNSPVIVNRYKKLITKEFNNFLTL